MAPFALDEAQRERLRALLARRTRAHAALAKIERGTPDFVRAGEEYDAADYYWKTALVNLAPEDRERVLRGEL